MKKTYIIALSVLAGLSSCFNKVENLFDEPAAERLKAKTEELRTLLTGAEYGWVIQYYPSSTRQYGGSNFVASFNEQERVTVLGETATDLSYKAESHYSLKNSQSVILTFDTYNTYIHSWSNPDATKENTYGGDFEWTYIQGDSQTLVFRGVKTGNTILFKALDKDMETAMRNIIGVRDNAYLNIQYIWDDGSENGFKITVNDDFSLLYHDDGKGGDAQTPFVYTETGILLYEPTLINGVLFSELEYDAENHKFTATDSGGQTVVWQGGYKTGLTPYESFIGTWDIHYILSSNEYTRRVNIVQQQKNRSYTMTGLYRDVTIKYDKEKSPRLHSQSVEITGNSSIRFCMWNNETGLRSVSDSDGVYLNYTMDSGNIYLTMENVIPTFATTGFLFMNEYTGNDQLQDTPNIQIFLKK